MKKTCFLLVFMGFHGNSFLCPPKNAALQTYFNRVESLRMHPRIHIEWWICKLSQVSNDADDCKNYICWWCRSFKQTAKLSSSSQHPRVAYGYLLVVFICFYMFLCFLICSMVAFWWFLYVFYVLKKPPKGTPWMVLVLAGALAFATTRPPGRACGAIPQIEAGSGPVLLAPETSCKHF